MSNASLDAYSRALKQSDEILAVLDAGVKSAHVSELVLTELQQLKTHDSIRSGIAKRAWFAQLRETKEDGPIADLRVWIERMRLCHFPVDNIMDSIRAKCGSDGLYPQMLAQATALFLEAITYMQQHPAPSMQMDSNEYRLWLSNAVISGMGEYQIAAIVHNFKNHIHSQLKITAQLITYLHRAEADYKECSGPYIEHMHNPSRSVEPSVWTIEIDNQSQRAGHWGASKPDYAAVFPVAYFHHVQINAPSQETVKFFLYAFTNDRFPGKANWYTLKTAAHLDKLLNALAMPRARVAGKLLWNKPNTLDYNNDVLADTSLNPPYYLQYHVNLHTHFVFRMCTLEEDGPLPQCLLQAFVPAPYRDAADPYTLHPPLTTRALRDAFTSQVKELYSKNVLINK